MKCKYCKVEVHECYNDGKLTVREFKNEDTTGLHNSNEFSIHKVGETRT